MMIEGPPPNNAGPVEVIESESTSSSTHLMYNRKKTLKEQKGGPYGPSPSSNGVTLSASQNQGSVYGASGWPERQPEETESNPSSPSERGHQMFPFGEVNQFQRTPDSGVDMNELRYPNVVSEGEIGRIIEINREVEAPAAVQPSPSESRASDVSFWRSQSSVQRTTD